MNILIDALPEAVEAQGRMWPVRTDFRVGLLFDGLMWDARVDALRKVERGLALVYPGERPGDVAEAWRAALWFFGGGAESGGGAEESGAERGRRVVDFEQDAPLVYAAFYAQYGVDLAEAKLHWWKFRAMFAGLLPEHAICRVMGVRGVNLAEVGSREERVRLAKQKRKWRIEGEGTSEGMARRAGALFG